MHACTGTLSGQGFPGLVVRALTWLCMGDLVGWTVVGCLLLVDGLYIVLQGCRGQATFKFGICGFLYKVQVQGSRFWGAGVGLIMSADIISMRVDVI